MVIALLFTVLLGLPSGATEAPSMSLEAATQHAGDVLSLIKERAKSTGVSLSSQQMLFARDMLIGYYQRNPHARKANVVWLRIPKEAKSEFEAVLEMVMMYIDPQRGAEHLHYDSYGILEPATLDQKLREQRRHLVVLDDFARFADQNTTAHQNISHFDRLNEYWNWMTNKAHARLTFFVVDEDGAVLREENFAGLTRLNFIGTTYGEENIRGDGETIDYLGSEAVHSRDCIKTLRLH